MSLIVCLRMVGYKRMKELSSYFMCNYGYDEFMRMDEEELIKELVDNVSRGYDEDELERILKDVERFIEKVRNFE